MKLILLEDIKKQGKKGDIIDVKDGYGSFLIKNKQAVVASIGSLDRLKRENDEKFQVEANKIKEAENIKKELEKLQLNFKVKTGEGDKVFGSVSPKQVSDKLKENGFNIDKKNIKSDSSLSSLGYHNIDIELHKKVIAKIKVSLTK